MTRAPTVPTLVAWQPWDAASFERARAAGRPVLLSIVAEWCSGCRAMDATTFADAGVAAAIRENFVPIRVDCDRQPDVAERYSLGGWPTTAFLDGDGAVLGGGTYVAPDRMEGVLRKVERAFRGYRGHAAPPPADGPRRTTPDGTTDAHRLLDGVLRILEAAAGPGEARFPHDAPLTLALERSQASGDPRTLELVSAALDDLGWGGLYDEEHGGFYRCASGPGWQAPDTAKLLAVNAALLQLFVRAGDTLGRSRLLDRAAGVLQYTQTWLADVPDGGWFASQHAADRHRDGEHAPPVSELRPADANAAMVSAVLHAARVLDDDGLRQFALQSLERVLLSCYQPGDGVAHYHDGVRRSRGLLADQVAMAGACLDAHEVTGNVVYEMMSEELAHFAIRTMWSEASGAFADRAAADDDVGLMRTRVEPFAANCEAARLLDRLAAASGHHEFAATAARVRDAMAPRAEAHGALAAHYLLALPAASLR